jgi:peroxin-2
MRYTYAQKTVARNVSFDFLNRQLVWEAFTEFLLFLMPLIDLNATRRWVRRTLHRFTPSTKGALENGQSSTTKKGPLAHLPEGICAICASQSAAPMNPDPSAHVTDPVDPTTSTAFLASLSKEASHAGQEATVPYVSSCCGAQYCYYCIAGALFSWEQAKKENEGTDRDQSKGWSCLRCAHPVLEIKRWVGDEGYSEKAIEIREKE